MLPGADRQDRGVVGRTLDAVVGGTVVVGAVAVLLPIGLIVFALVRDQVTQGEAVVRGDEVDGGDGFAAGAGVDVTRAADPCDEVVDQSWFTAPEIPHHVPVLAVPLRPLRGERPHLVAGRSHVPGLGDQFHLAEHRVLRNEGEEGRDAVDGVHLPGQGWGKVETESVDVHLGHPVAQ